jgi:site-specific DNA-methyltransferase (cytosine-N4-specific)
MATSWIIKGKEPQYKTALGAAYMGDALELMRDLDPNSVNLIITSPPFALQRRKEYGNVDADDYVKWFEPFAKEFKRILKPSGSLVIHIGGSWVKGIPVKSIYQYELLVCLHRKFNFFLAQDLYWFNKAKLPGPAQWVTVKRWRLKDAVDQIWWLSKTPCRKADNRRVLKEYSPSMKELLRNNNYYKPNVSRPSEHKISNKFYNGHRGAIPSNIFDYSNTDSKSKYMRLCRKYGIRPHPARYPYKIPEFFIKFLTNKGSKVLDPFSGSNVTGEAAEALGRKWMCFEIRPDYLQASMFRFFDEKTLETKYGFKEKFNNRSDDKTIVTTH